MVSDQILFEGLARSVRWRQCPNHGVCLEIAALKNWDGLECRKCGALGRDGNNGNNGQQEKRSMNQKTQTQAQTAVKSEPTSKPKPKGPRVKPKPQALAKRKAQARTLTKMKEPQEQSDQPLEPEPTIEYHNNIYIPAELYGLIKNWADEFDRHYHVELDVTAATAALIKKGLNSWADEWGQAILTHASADEALGCKRTCPACGG